METAFLVCAALGGTLLVCQFLAGLAGFGADHDVDADHDHDLGADGDGDHGNGFLSLLSIRAGSAAVTFFGLGGMTALYYGVEEPAALAVALGAGDAAVYAVAAAMKALAGLKAVGTARVERSVGRGVGVLGWYGREPCLRLLPKSPTAPIEYTNYCACSDSEHAS
ncbi:MAG: hypothetical protein K2X91_04635 [Thermoleophilia bacterium]|nr:hypothetical protein [Thermoleophilia bacterium]